MSEIPKETSIPEEVGKPLKPSSEKLSQDGISAIRGVNEKSPDAPQDIVGQPQVEARGFGSSDTIANTDVTDYVAEYIPPRHLNNLESIEYVPEYVVEHSRVLEGRWNPTYPASIQIFQPNPSGQETSPTYMKGTITHEIGHNAFENALDKQNQENWHTLSTTNPVWDSKAYASVDPYEDFAESYKWYVTNPTYLEYKAPNRYNFMRSVVFGGREYK